MKRRVINETHKTFVLKGQALTLKALLMVVQLAAHVPHSACYHLKPGPRSY